MENSLVATIVTIIVVMGVILTICGGLIFAERKVSAWVQDRIGPNRVGPWGLLQSLADGLKFILKEDIIPVHVDKLLYLAAPAIAMSTALLAFCVVPFGPTTVLPEPVPNAQALETYRSTYQFVIAPNVDIGIVLIFAITSLTVYAIILGGWASNNKYSFIGGLRSSAQLVSYEIPMGLSIFGVVLMTGSLNLERIIDEQVNHGVWFGFLQPLAFLLFLTSAFAECNRLPFDLPEAEQELVGGYHTEYSAMKFAMFFLGEYTHMVTTSFLMTALFLGGWHFWGIPETGWVSIVLKLVVIFAKVTFFIMVYMLIRWTLPRFRFDQLMGMAWKVLIPLALINLVGVLVAQHLIRTYQADWAWYWILLPFSLIVLVGAGFVAVIMPTAPPRRQVLVSQEGRQLEMVSRQ
jgi:NADH-quinone oxidoreductase subunit H